MIVYPEDGDWTRMPVYLEAKREDWCRAQVAAAGKDWSTHMVKFSGAVVLR